MSATDVLNMINEKNVKFVDFRFTDTQGKEQHVSVPASTIDEGELEDGKMFDGSSIAGWKGINASDMILMPDCDSQVIDPFCEEVTMNIRCDIIEPSDMKGYNRDPRSIAKRAEVYLNSTGIGDTAYFGPENEFFVFDSIRWTDTMGEVGYSIGSEEAAWSTHEKYDGGNMGHRPGVKGGYFMGAKTEVHHHEVGTAGQCEIGAVFNTLVRKADEVQIFKYVVHNVAHAYGKTATFMPKPIVGDNGNGMHVHQSIFKDGENMFHGDLYGGLSQTALYYIGGIIKHAKALNAFANASTNSYKRLVPGFEAPVMLAYSARNRSAAIRIPHIPNPKGRRIEVRFGDNAANPYLCFASMLMAGLDGIKNKIDPGEAASKDLYDLPPEEEAMIPQVAVSLDEALAALDTDRAFDDDMIDAFIELKNAEVQRLRMSTHPCEFDMYYSI